MYQIRAGKQRPYQSGAIWSFSRELLSGTGGLRAEAEGLACWTRGIGQPCVKDLDTQDILPRISSFGHLIIF